MPPSFHPRQVFSRGVGPRHLVALGIAFILLGPLAPGLAGNGIIMLLVADLWWIVNHRPNRDDSNSHSDPPGGAA